MGDTPVGGPTTSLSVFYEGKSLNQPWKGEEGLLGRRRIQEIPQTCCPSHPISVTGSRYVAGMDIETATNESIEQELLHGEAAIARIRATQLVLLREVDRRQMPIAAGCASLGEWVRGRLDVSPETARDLVATTRHLEELPDVQEAVEVGEIGFDRAVAVGRFARRDDTFDVLNEMAGYDIAGIRNRAARRRGSSPFRRARATADDGSC